MKTNLLILIVFLALSCRNDDLSRRDEISTSHTPLPTSMKGYELYSWQSSGTWSYTLITGTNRLKTHDEIVTRTNSNENGWVKITVQNTDGLKNLLGRLEAGQAIVWISNPTRVEGFSLPPGATLMEVEDYCKTHDLTLDYIN